MKQFGRYTIDKKIGEGGTASVYLAKDAVFGDVVLKIMSNQNMPTGIDHEKLLIDEARRTLELHHKNIIRVHTAVEKSPETENAYIVMEYLSGGTLKDRIVRNLPYTPVKVIREIASALDYCYQEKEIIHRDLKPTNILFRESSTGELSAVLTDFGISKNQNDQSDFTSIGVRVGTPKYMSPEQFYGEALTQQSDLYSLGIIFYEMLVGSVPYDSNNTTTIIKTITKNERPKLPEEHAKYQPIINNLLSALPEERFLNARKLINALDELEMENPTEKRGKNTKSKFPIALGASLATLVAVGAFTVNKFFIPTASEPVVSEPVVSDNNFDSDLATLNQDLNLSIKSADIRNYISLRKSIDELIIKHPEESIFPEKKEIINGLIDTKIISIKTEIGKLSRYNRSEDYNKFESSLYEIISNDFMPDTVKSYAKEAMADIKNTKRLLERLDSAIHLTVKHPSNKKYGITNPKSIDELSIINLTVNYPSYLHCTYQSPDGHTVRLYPIPKAYLQLPYMKGTKIRYTRHDKLATSDKTKVFLGETGKGTALITCFSATKSFKEIAFDSFTLKNEYEFALKGDLKSLERAIGKETDNIFGKTSFRIDFK